MGKLINRNSSENQTPRGYWMLKEDDFKVLQKFESGGARVEKTDRTIVDRLVRLGFLQLGYTRNHGSMLLYETAKLTSIGADILAREKRQRVKGKKTRLLSFFKN